jgi:hypothetical protein
MIITLCLLFAAFMAMAAVFAVLLYAGIAAGCVLVWAFRRWCEAPDPEELLRLIREDTEREAAYGGEPQTAREASCG